MLRIWLLAKCRTATHCLSLERTRDVRTVKPIDESNPAASVRLGELSHPSRPTNKPKEVARVSVTQCLQCVRNMKPRNNEPQPSSLFLPGRTQSPLRAYKQDKRSCASFCHRTPSTDTQHETSRWQAPCQRKSSSSSVGDRLC